jgi:hypothetical protein
MDKILDTLTSTNLEEDRGLSVRQSFLKFPGETPEVDYKDGVKFVAGEDFALKLIKHILGMANAGGGYIVIGYKENTSGHPEAIPNLAEDIVSSYDPSTLAQTVERYTAGTEKINLMVHKDPHPDTKTIYPIIQVFGFKKRPFFCKSSAGNGILKEGALYIRIASARTIEVATPDEWDQLIDICVARRQDEMIKRFSSLMKEIGISTKNRGTIAEATQDAKTLFQRKTDVQKWLESVRKEAKELALRDGFKFEGLEVVHWLIDPPRLFNHKELRDYAEQAVLRHTGWPMGLVMHRPEISPKPDKNGIKTIISEKGHGFDYWYFNNDGSFYLFRAFEEDTRERREKRESESNRVMFFDTRLWRVAEGVKHCLTLYKKIGVAPTSKIKLQVNHYGINGRQLTASDPMRAFTMFTRTSGTENVEWERTVSLDALEANLTEIIFEICRKLYIMFDFWEPGAGVMESVFDQFNKSRL